MHDTMITIQGYLGTEVERREVNGATVATFRVAATPRRFNRRERQWSDADTQWFSVSAWRALGDNCAASLSTGDPVVIHGRLNASTWLNHAGLEVTTYDVEAVTVGHDLNRGASSFSKTVRGDGATVRRVMEPGPVPDDEGAVTEADAVVA